MSEPKHPALEGKPIPKIKEEVTEHDANDRSVDCVHQCKICNQKYANFACVPKQVDGSKPRIIYFCNLCGRYFAGKRAMMEHLGYDRPCFEIRDMSFLKTMVNWGNIEEIEKIFLTDEQEFEKMCGAVSSVADVLEAKKKMNKIKTNYSKLLAYIRIQVQNEVLNEAKIKHLETLMTEYKIRIQNINEKYATLIF